MAEISTVDPGVCAAGLPRRAGLPWVLAASLALGCSGAEASESESIAGALLLEPGMTVADVGAGEGEWSLALARIVGAEGRVYATEVDSDLVETIRLEAREAGLGNVTALLGDQERTGLSPNCCDGILLRLVYHHFTDPPAMRSDLRAALRPGGLLAIVDITPQSHWRDLPDVPDRGGHGIPPEDLILEMEGDGFELVERMDHWAGDPDRFCLVFRHGAPR